MVRLQDFPSAVALLEDAALSADFASDSAGGLGVQPLGIARPANTDQVTALVQWANARKVALVPCSSRSGPRRRGDTVSSRPSVLVDLSGLDRVVHVDGDNRIAIIEPGVTFAAFDRALKPHGLRSLKPLMPRIGKSVLASHLEREPITSPYDQWDTSDPLSAIELVFGEGSRFRTGGAALPGTLEENLERGLRQMVSVGPMATDFTRVLQGAQGSLGIACWGSVYCERIPPSERAYFVAGDALGPLTELAYRLLWHRTRGQLFIVDRVQLALMLAKDRDDFEAWKGRLPSWILYMNLTSAPNFAEEHLRYVEADVAAEAAKLGLKLDPVLGGVKASDLHEILQAPLDGDYKSRAFGDYSDFFFLSQLDKANGFIDAVGKVSGDAGFYIQPMVQGVSCHIEVTFPHEPGGRVRAGDLRSAAVAACSAEGAFFSRPYAPWGGVAFKADPQAAATFGRIKELLDPNGIMNPDRFTY